MELNPLHSVFLQFFIYVGYIVYLNIVLRTPHSSICVWLGVLRFGPKSPIVGHSYILQQSQGYAPIVVYLYYRQWLACSVLVSNRPVIVVEFVRKVVTILVRYTLELGDIRMVYPLRVRPRVVPFHQLEHVQRSSETLNLKVLHTPSQAKVLVSYPVFVPSLGLLPFILSLLLYLAIEFYQVSDLVEAAIHRLHRPVLWNIVYTSPVSGLVYFLD